MRYINDVKTQIQATYVEQSSKYFKVMQESMFFLK